MALKSFYPLYTDLSDSVGGNTGSGSLTFSASGPSTGSGQFASDRVTATAAAITGSFTIGLEAYREGSSSNNGAIYEVGSVGGTGFGFYTWGTGGFGIPDGGISWRINGTYNNFIATAVTLPNNAWSEIVSKYDGANVKTFQDGDLKSTVAHTTNPASSTSAVLGDRNDAPGDYWNGRMTRAFTDNTAWTDADIKNNYASHKGFF